MRRMVAWCVLALGVAVGAAWGADADSYLGYIKEDGAYVEGLRGVERVAGPWSLPHSEHAVGLTLSPADGAAVYFTRKSPAEAATEGEEAEAGWICAPPYDHAEQLPGALGHHPRIAAPALRPAVYWSSGGQTLYWGQAGTEPKTWRWNRKTGVLDELPLWVDGVTADGQTVVGWTYRGPVSVYDVPSGQLRTVVTQSRSDRSRLWAALRSAQHPEAFAGLSPSAPSADRWTFTPAAMSADGEWVWFACNMGHADANDAYTYVMFAYNRRRERVYALSTVGVLRFGVLDDLQLSRDGEYLLLRGTMLHLAAANSTVTRLRWVHLPDQACGTLALAGPDLPGRYNIGWTVWSPHSGMIAVRVAESTSDRTCLPDGWDGLLLVDKQTGMVLRSVAGASAPVWSSAPVTPQDPGSGSTRR